MAENCETSLEPIVELSTSSVMKSEVFGYVWTIENFANFIDRTYEVFTPVFTFDSCSEIKWRISLHPQNSYPKGVQLGFCLMKVSDDEKVQSVKYKISIIDDLDNHIVLQTKEKLFRYVFDFDSCLLIPHSELKTKKLLPNGSLTIRCEMDILLCENPVNFDPDISNLLKGQIHNCNDFSNISFDSIALEKKMNSLKDCSLDSYNNDNSNVEEETDDTEEHIDSISVLSRDLEKLYLTKHLYDVTIRTDSVEWCGHKAILSIRSEFFRKAFKEDSENRLLIPGVKSTTFEAILYYLYTGKMRNLTVEFALDILTASKKFLLWQLEEILTAYLKTHMTEENVTEILHVAEDLELEDLKINGLKYISSNKLDVDKMEKWDNLLQNNPHAAGEVLLTIASFQKRNIT